MTTRSRRAATPCEVSEPAGTEALRVRPTPARWGVGGGERTRPKGKEVSRAQFPSSHSQVGYKWPGRRKLWGGVVASREFWSDAGGRFLERGATLVASSQSSCTEPFLCATLGCGSGRWMERETGEGCLSAEAAGIAPRAVVTDPNWARGAHRRAEGGECEGTHTPQVTKPTSIPAG